MTEQAAVHAPSAAFVATAHVDAAGYAARYAASVADPDRFWAAEAKRIDWIKAPTKIKNTSFMPGNIDIRWFEDGTLNISANCIDRHLAARASQTAILWEPDDPKAPARHISYAELHDQVCRLANVLKAQGVKKGDRVVLYMPMIPEAAYAMLACARIGAIHSVVFGGFSADALANRINDCDARILITADYAPRGGKATPLKANADAALLHCDDRVKCLVVRHTGGQTTWTEGRDIDLRAEMAAASADCAAVEVGAEDPLF
ncbi:MAG: AMP-binding protein, partial [Paracoccaceae bacterium]